MVNIKQTVANVLGRVKVGSKNTIAKPKIKKYFTAPPPRMQFSLHFYINIS